jgi:acetyl-CoA carboxylase carboxyl transferase subunit alpha
MPDQMLIYLEFEKSVAELEAKINELRALAATGSDIGDEIKRIEEKSAQALAELYANLTPWQKTLVARHSQRPHFTDFINALISEFTPFAGDRKFGEDEALMGGFGRFQGEAICVIGQEKGNTTESRIKHNFGMARPEGYRKAVRLMEMADKFRNPRAVDRRLRRRLSRHRRRRARTGRSDRALDRCLPSLGVPNVAIVTGEGMSGGAIAITTANKVLMFEHAIYSVISPEAASSILWRDGTKAQEAANSMKITAQDMLRFGVIDRILQSRPAAPIAIPRDDRRTGEAIAQAFDELRNLEPTASAAAAAEISRYRPQAGLIPASVRIALPRSVTCLGPGMSAKRRHDAFTIVRLGITARTWRNQPFWPQLGQNRDV